MASMVSTVSILALLLVMSAQIGHSKIYGICDKFVPLAGNWSLYNGSHYVQQAYSGDKRQTTSVKCLKISITPITAYNGTSSLSYVSKVNQKSVTLNRTWIELDALVFNLTGKVVTAPASQAYYSGIAPKDLPSVNTIIYGDINACFMAICQFSKKINQFVMTKAFLITLKRHITNADANHILRAVHSLYKISPSNMVVVDQVNCV